MKLVACEIVLFLHVTSLYGDIFPFLLYPTSFTKYGLVQGRIEYSRNKRPYYSFRGIPYAKPPVNDLRFKAPQPPDNWSILDATKDGPVCIQKNYFFANPKVEGQEDCLYLNVYTPKNTIKLFIETFLPVMVFFHWGGFLAGRGTSDYIGPEYFMDKDVVLVTFNYRLGVFGFLTTLDDEAPGNYALKDQVAALKWVQENIHYFGGDRSRVTIFGQSAGAGSTHYHMLSPLSRGLFHAAISQSGSALALWATPNNEIQKTVINAQAVFVNCDAYIGNNTKLVACLRNIPATQLVDSQDLFKTFFVDPLTVYTTVTENQTKANPKPFFTKLPIEYIEANEFTRVPWIIGVVKDEGILKSSSIIRQSRMRETLNSNFEAILSELMYLSLSTTDSHSLYANVTAKYLGNKEFIDISDPKNMQGFTNLYTDRSFAYSSYQSAMIHAMQGHNSIWFYNFGYRGLHSYGDLFAATQEDVDFSWGVSHCDDLLYLFNSPGLFPALTEKSDIDMSNAMVDLWTNFAIYRNPNPLENLVFNVNWEPLDPDILQSVPNKNDNFCFLNITGNYSSYFHASSDCEFYKSRIAFWAGQDLLENLKEDIV